MSNRTRSSRWVGIGRGLLLGAVVVLTVALASGAPRGRDKKTKGSASADAATSAWVDAGLADAGLGDAGLADAAGLAANSPDGATLNAARDAAALVPIVPSLTRAATPAPSASTTKELAPSAALPVRARDVVVLNLHLADGGLSAAERAARANHAIESALADADPSSVHVDWRDGRAILFIGPTPVVELTRADAEASGEGSLDLLAASAADRIRQALKSEATRSQVMQSVLKVTLVLLLGVLGMYIGRKLGNLAYRIRNYFDRHPERIPALRFRSIEVLKPHVLRSALVVGISGLKWLLQIGLLYAWLLFTLSRFDVTKGYTQRINQFVVAPFSTLLTRMASLLPLALLICLATIALALLLRFVTLFFASVERRETTLEGLRPELARPANALTQAVLVVAALVLVAPVVTGNPDGALARVGMVAILTIALAATPLIASILVGARLMFLGSLRVGSQVEVAGTEGKVERITLLELVLSDGAKRSIHVPHLVTLFRPLRFRPPVPFLVVELPVSARAVQRNVISLLAEAAAKFGDEPAVELCSLDADMALYRISLVPTDPSSTTTLLLIALQEALVAHKVPLSSAMRHQTVPAGTLS